MKSIVSLLFVVLSLIPSSVYAVTRQEVQQGIQKTENLVKAHNWHEAFATLRAMDTNIGSGQPALHYLITKERFILYSRINKNVEAYNNITAMENLAKASGDKATIEDMLLTKADYYSHKGKTAISTQCYKEYFSLRSAGKKNDDLEACFKSTIAESKQNKRFAMANTIQNMYNAWQDSIAGERSAAAMKTLQKKYDTAQEDISSKASKITTLWFFITVLAIIAIALAVVLLFFILLKVRNTLTINKLRKSLDIANTNSGKKSLFIRNISSQISPSLDEISKGNTKQHVEALRTMLKHIEEYMALEDTRDEKYPSTDTDIEKVCRKIASETTTDAIPVTVEDVQKLSFPLNEEAIENVLKKTIEEMRTDSHTDHITLKFKKRNPNTGNFIITAVGMKIPQEDRENLFTAFSKVYDLTVTDGLTFPTCALIAYKMGSNMYLDQEFAKGTRLVLEVHK